MLACADPSLDGPVVLFQDVIKDMSQNKCIIISSELILWS